MVDKAPCITLSGQKELVEVGIPSDKLGQLADTRLSAIHQGKDLSRPVIVDTCGLSIKYQSI